MFGFLLAIHTLIAILLIVVILMQQSRGSGLSSVFGGGAQSFFGGRGAEPFFLKTTTVLGILFMITSTTLAFTSPGRARKRVPAPMKQNIPAQTSIPGQQTNIPAPAQKQQKASPSLPQAPVPEKGTNPQKLPLNLPGGK